MIFLVRITLLPFAISSYLLGLTSVKFHHYFVGSLAVMIHIFIWLYIGSTLTRFDNFGALGEKSVE